MTTIAFSFLLSIVTALKFLDPNTDVPWQRVVSSSGKISSRGPGTTGAQRQKEALEDEGVEVRTTRENEIAVRWDACGWFPESINLEIEDGSETYEEEMENHPDAEAIDTEHGDAGQQ